MFCDGQCINTPGSYECSCQDEGTTLYRENGTEGFFLRNNEDGLRAGDFFFINHTCVRKYCEHSHISTRYTIMYVAKCTFLL